MQKAAELELHLQPQQKDLGDGFVVRRSLPSLAKKNVGPFVFWDHMGPVEFKAPQEMLVRVHPHIGLATITYLFSGRILHRDSLGNEQWIRPGEVNWMTAGRGIAHSERSFAEDPPQKLEGIQLWLALPKESEEVEPSFVHHKESSLPEIIQLGIRLRLIAGAAFGQESPIPVYSDLFYMQARMEAGAYFSMDLKPGHEAAVYVIDGEIEHEGQIYRRFDMICFRVSTAMSFTVLQEAQLMLFGGEIFPEPRHVWWNFVSSRKERIEQAKADWQADRFGVVPNESQRIPLPEN